MRRCLRVHCNRSRPYTGATPPTDPALAERWIEARTWSGGVSSSAEATAPQSKPPRVLQLECGKDLERCCERQRHNADDCQREVRGARAAPLVAHVRVRLLEHALGEILVRDVGVQALGVAPLHVGPVIAGHAKQELGRLGVLGVVAVIAVAEQLAAQVVLELYVSSNASISALFKRLVTPAFEAMAA